MNIASGEGVETRKEKKKKKKQKKRKKEIHGAHPPGLIDPPVSLFSFPAAHPGQGGPQPVIHSQLHPLKQDTGQRPLIRSRGSAKPCVIDTASLALLQRQGSQASGRQGHPPATQPEAGTDVLTSGSAPALPEHTPSSPEAQQTPSEHSREGHSASPLSGAKGSRKCPGLTGSAERDLTGDPRQPAGGSGPHPSDPEKKWSALCTMQATRLFPSSS